MSPLAWLRDLPGRRIEASGELDRLRRLAFSLLLPISGALALGVAAFQMELLRPEWRLPMRAMLLAWAAIHPLLWSLARGPRPHRWHVAYAAASFGILMSLFANVDLDPLQAIGFLFTYHAALLVVIMLLVPFAEAALLSTATTALVVAFVTVRHPPGASHALIVAVASPPVSMSLLSCVVALLLERSRASLRHFEADLRGQNERLEAEVARRTETIEQQRQQLFQKDKMEAIGTLAAGVAHDFNNLLTPILALANDIRRQARPGDEDLIEAAEIICRSAERAAQLNRQLLGFARKGKLQTTSVDVHRAVGEVVALLSRTLERSIAIKQRLEAAPPLVVGDPTQLQQVVLNLAVNARDAMPQGGELRLWTSRARLAPGAEGPKDLPPGDYLVLEVGDTGSGIAPEIRERVFEPFFTTKPSGRGSGMGLAMVYGIVKNHGGAIELQTELGRGSTFRVWLPAADRLEAAQAAAATEARGKGHILVVDDEELVRAGTCRVLKNMGYRVASAADGLEALERFQAAEPRFDLVLLDLGMPRMDGLACLKELKRRAPEARVVVTTGYAMDGAAQQALAEGASACLQKPFGLPEMSEVIRKELARA